MQFNLRFFSLRNTHCIILKLYYTEENTVRKKFFVKVFRTIFQSILVWSESAIVILIKKVKVPIIALSFSLWVSILSGSQFFKFQKCTREKLIIGSVFLFFWGLFFLWIPFVYWFKHLKHHFDSWIASEDLGKAKFFGEEHSPTMPHNWVAFLSGRIINCSHLFTWPPFFFVILLNGKTVQ